MGYLNIFRIFEGQTYYLTKTKNYGIITITHNRCFGRFSWK